MKLSSILAFLPFCAALVPRQAIAAEAVEVIADWAVEGGETLECEFDVNPRGVVVHPSAGVEILHQNPLGNDLVRVVFKKVDEFLGLEGHAEIIYNRYTHEFRYFKSNSLQVIPGHTYKGLQGGTQVGNKFLPVARAFQ